MLRYWASCVLCWEKQLSQVLQSVLVTSLLRCSVGQAVPQPCSSLCNRARMLRCSVTWFALSFKCILLIPELLLHYCCEPKTRSCKGPSLCTWQMAGSEAHPDAMAVLSRQMWQQGRRKLVCWWSLAVCGARGSAA